jgi:hypothetical protein
MTSATAVAGPVHKLIHQQPTPLPQQQQQQLPLQQQTQQQLLLHQQQQQ